MLELLEAIFLGVVQGLTEFLPVSSSGHLLLGQYFLGMDQARFGLTFDAAIHTGTVLAVISYFWRDLLRMAGAFLRSLRGPNFEERDQRMAYLILVATVPAGVIGLLFKSFFEGPAVRSPWLVAFNLVLVGVLFIVGEVVGRQNRTSDKLGFKEALAIGLAQTVALFPGVSRSGGTITLGLFLGLRRDEAARFSFLMSVPITAAAALLSLAEAFGSGIDAGDALLFVAGSVTSGVVGYLAIRFLLNYLAGHSLRVFAYYRFVLAAVVVLLLLVGVGGF
ncbi:MAG: undecaprenyl-diphosphatase UppP [Rubrobacteraceae bacterium]|nr:undecaprenyl-diphosphatase UppP [Rubrobacteraceae bacterium]